MPWKHAVRDVGILVVTLALWRVDAAWRVSADFERPVLEHDGIVLVVWSKRAQPVRETRRTPPSPAIGRA